MPHDNRTTATPAYPSARAGIHTAMTRAMAGASSSPREATLRVVARAVALGGALLLVPAGDAALSLFVAACGALAGHLETRRRARSELLETRDACARAEAQAASEALRHGGLEGLIDELTTEVARRSRVEAGLRRACRLARHEVEHDALTGLASRRAFEVALRHEWRQCRTERWPLSLVLCDVDRFREYNQRYGHHTGDRCLAQVAALLAGYPQRAGDVLARYGGEEFALLLPRTGEHAALDIAEVIRAAVFERTILHGASDVERVVTLTCGVATIIPDDLGRGEDLVEAAAHALHRAKRAGRNCVYTVYGALALDER